MRKARFFARGQDLKTLEDLGDFDEKIACELELAEEDLIKQLKFVLRLGAGNRFYLLDNKGYIYELEIRHFERSSKVICVLCRREKLNCDTGALLVRVGLSLIKGERFDWCIEKLSELGVGEIIPLVCQRSVVRLDMNQDAKTRSRIGGKVSRWQSIACEAAEQCERPTAPPVVEPLPLLEFLKQRVSGTETDIKELRFICVERGRQFAPLVKALTEEISVNAKSKPGRIGSISLLVGPEGGFAGDELQAALELDWLPVTLSPHILRSETAAIAAMAQVASVLDI